MTHEPKGGDGQQDPHRQVPDTERLKALRERLYARGTEEKGFERHTLSPNAHTTPLVPTPTPAPVQAKKPESPLSNPQPIENMSRTSRTSFRMKMLILGILFLVGALVVSGMFLFMGTNTISGNNITIDVTGPVAVGGGDVMNLQIAIVNKNSLPIESATLIVTYPLGSQSVTDAGKELFSDRQLLNNINPNEVVNVPVRFLVFGEENDEREVKVAVEYRVRGSNATFYKESVPFGFKISSSPIQINIEGAEKVSSGQEVEMQVEVQSNSKETLHDLLLKVAYPAGFDFTDAEPETASGQDTWRLSSLEPGEKQTISFRGIMVGNESDANRFDVTVGVANERDELNIVSPLSANSHVVQIERPFLDVGVSINGNTEETVIISPNSAASVSVLFKNTLESTVYDGKVFVELSGNALNEIDVDVTNGYYDSSKNVISWDAIGVEELEEIAPGATRRVNFSIDPRRDIASTPEIKLTVTTQANRIGEDRVEEQIVGSVKRTIRLASESKLISAAIYTGGPFPNSGPVPPVAEETTQYTLFLSVLNGTNPVTGAEVTAVMPQYVSWLDITTDDSVTYNAANRTIKWRVNELKESERKEVWMQVALTPSLSQVGLTPTLLETQRYRATDRFTGTVIRAEAPALTTVLLEDPDAGARDGRVQESE